MEQAKEVLKKAVKIVIKHLTRVMIPIAAFIILIVVILSAAVYFLTILDRYI